MNTSEHSLKVVHKVHVKPGIPGCCPPSDGVVPDRCAPPYGLVLSNGRYVYFVHPRTMSAVVANFTRVGNDRAERLAGKATFTSGLLLGRSEVLRRLRHYLRAQSQGHHTIDRLEERGVERGSARRSSLKGRERAIVSRTNIGTVSKATLGKLLGDMVERI